jgi:WD40 repeat protein
MNQDKILRSVWLLFTLAALLATREPASAQTTEPILRVEVGTHNAGIISMALDPANRILVTGSEDKTARVWDISGTGKLLRILRPPVGEWEQGHIFAVALSPDAKTVACGGRTGSPQQKDACVYLFDRATGDLTRRLGGLPGWVQRLVYTADGRFLVAVTGEWGGKASWAGMSIFRLPDYALVAEDRDYGDYIGWVDGDPTGSRLATTCFDGFIRLYDLTAVTARDAVPPAPIVPASKIRLPGGDRLWGLAFSPDGTRLAVGFHVIPKVDVIQVKGNILEYAYSPDTSGVKETEAQDLRTVAWSSDGLFLYAGGSYRSKGRQQIRKWAEGGRGRYSNLPVGVDLHFTRLLPLREGGIAFASRDGSFGKLNDRDEATLLGPQAIPIYANLYEGFRLSPDGAGIQFAYERSGSSPALFLLNERRLADPSSSLWAGLNANLALQAPITDGLGVTDWKNSFAPKIRGKPLHLKNELAKSLAIKPDRSGFVLGTNTSLWLFDPAGNELWRVRMPGAVFAVNTNGRVAVAAFSDGTIRWYRISDGEEILAFFPHPDRKRWILWTPSGYYDASPGGEDLIGWHVNNGKDNAADFFPASRFRSTYHRPDVIDRVLKTLDGAVALKQANEESGRKQAAQVSVREKLPPVVAIASPADEAEVSATPVKVRYSARSHEPLTGLKVLVDGRPVFTEGAGKTVKESGDLSVSIPSRDCEISIIAENRYAVSEPAIVRLRWKGVVPAQEEFQIKPTLYVLAVGVSQYKDSGLRLGLAAKDALDFGSAWAEQKGRLYSGVEARVLTDGAATKGNILDGLEWLQQQVTQKDVAVLFFAGHGINDPNGVFYFLPVDADPEKLKRTGISQSDITSTVAAMAGKVLVFVDACHSGDLMGKVKRRGSLDISSVINELASAENGAVVFSSATGRQYALESVDWGNGAFTKGLVEGIEGKASYGETGRITVNMLDLYVSERVKELTGGQQTPTTVKPPNVPDFPLAVLTKSK